MNNHFLILSNPRQGTKFLQSLLPGNQMPEIFRRWRTSDGAPLSLDDIPEVTRLGRPASESDLHGKNPLERLDYYRQRRGSCSSVKVFYIDLPTSLPDPSEVKLLVLKRSDALQSFLSLQIALKTNEFNFRLDDYMPKFQVSLGAYEAYKKWLDAEQKYRSLFSVYDALCVEYADLVDEKLDSAFDTPLCYADNLSVDQESSMFYDSLENMQEVKSWFRKDWALWQEAGYFARNEALV